MPVNVYRTIIEHTLEDTTTTHTSMVVCNMPTVQYLWPYQNNVYEEPEMFSPSYDPRK